ncbi:MAG: sugar ABC transporter permease [Pseudomonadota bacterium]
MRALLQRAGFDPRFSSMLLALIAIWILLAIFTDGVFLSPRNLYNLSIQTCVTGVMTCGMVYLIVARQIDLSVGSLLAFAGMLIAQSQVNFFPVDAAWGWPVSILVGLAVGMLVGVFQGWWVAYRGVPAFVVTLAGYLMYRGAAFMVSDGQTIAPLNAHYQMLGGGMSGSIGVWPSVALGAFACAVVVWHRWAARQSRKRYSAEQPPIWADVLKVSLMCGAIIAFVAVMNSYPDPTNVDAAGIAAGKGIAIPVLVLLVIVALLTFVSSNTRFGRYVFAYGGNPEAALLSGINTKRLLLQLFMLMGALAAVAGMITTARLNSGANSIGQMAELYVIAAAVIGGTSLAGGLGTIPGAIVGAIMIQTLDNGMVLLDVSSAKRQIFIGMILIAAVWFDTVYNRKEGK